MKRDKPPRKERVTFSLSREALEFLRTLQKREHSPSLSASVENMIDKTKHARDLADLEASVSAYYNSLPEEEIRAESAWGKSGAAGLAAFESEAEQTIPELVRASR